MALRYYLPTSSMAATLATFSQLRKRGTVIGVIDATSWRAERPSLIENPADQLDNLGHVYLPAALDTFNQLKGVLTLNRIFDAAEVEVDPIAVSIYIFRVLAAGGQRPFRSAANKGMSDQNTVPVL